MLMSTYLIFQDQRGQKSLPKDTQKSQESSSRYVFMQHHVHKYPLVFCIEVMGVVLSKHSLLRPAEYIYIG